MGVSCDYERLKFYRIERNGIVVIGVNHPCFLNCGANVLEGEVEAFLNDETVTMSHLIGGALNSGFAKVDEFGGCVVADVVGARLDAGLLGDLVSQWGRVIGSTRSSVMGPVEAVAVTVV